MLLGLNFRTRPVSDQTITCWTVPIACGTVRMRNMSASTTMRTQSLEGFHVLATAEFGVTIAVFTIGSQWTKSIAFVDDLLKNVDVT